MKIRFFSDLHLNFSPDPERDIELFIMPLKEDKETYLFLAGDITTKKHHIDTIKNLSKRFKKTFIVTGNHEYYDKEFFETNRLLKEAYENSNVSFLNNSSDTLDENWIVFGSSFWTSIGMSESIKKGLLCREISGYRMNDYRYIMYGDKRLTPVDTSNEFIKTYKKANEFIKENKNKNIIILSHHSPVTKTMGKYKSLNEAYYEPLINKLLENSNVKLLIHGHTHIAVDTVTEETRVVSNPLGYGLPEDSFKYSPYSVIDL